MNGILIYTEEEARRNSFAVEKITGLLEIPLVISERDEIPDNIDFAVNRTDNAEIAKGLESRGVRVFNPYSLSLLANDKQKCYEFMQKNGVEIMPINQKSAPVVDRKTRRSRSSRVTRLRFMGLAARAAKMFHS